MPDEQQIEGRYQRIVQQTFDLKNDIEFGYAVPRDSRTYNELLGSRAYQRALNKVKADLERSRQDEEDERKRQAGIS